MDKAQAMRIDACLPQSWWEFAVNTATHLYHHTPVCHLEWQTITTIYLPVALISLWGTGSAQVSQSTAAQLKQILDHTMDLVSAVSLACMR